MLKLKDMVGRFFATGDDYKKSDKPINYVVAHNGVFEIRKNELGSFIRKVDKIPRLDSLEEGVYLNIPKIPFEYFNKMVSWFKEIYKLDKTESTIFLFYHKEKGFKLWVPRQENGSASSNYKREDDKEYNKLISEGYILVMIAHSHPWKSTSVRPSGIDDRDEKEPILYMVVGNVEEIPVTYCSTCPGGNRMKLNFFDIFENPINNENVDNKIKSLLTQHVPEQKIFELYVDTSYNIPKSWIKKHKARSYTSYRSRSLSQYSLLDYEPHYLNSAKNYYDMYNEAKRQGYGIGRQYETVDDYKDYDTVFQEIDEIRKFTGTLDPTIADSYLGDVIDTVLDMSEESIAELLVTLADEGYKNLLRKVIVEVEKHPKGSEK